MHANPTAPSATPARSADDAAGSACRHAQSGNPPRPAGSAAALVPTPSRSRTSIEPPAGETGVLTVWVPYEAKVTINGMLTKSTGSKRHFVSYGLQPGYTYKYEVKAEIVRDGKIVTEEHTVSLTAGERERRGLRLQYPRSRWPRTVIGRDEIVIEAVRKLGTWSPGSRQTGFQQLFGTVVINRGLPPKFGGRPFLLLLQLFADRAIIKVYAELARQPVECSFFWRFCPCTIPLPSSARQAPWEPSF